MVTEETIPTLVVVMAHSDDAEILCFGTMLRMIKKGYHAHLIVVCRDYRPSTSDMHGVLTQVSQRRRQETLDAFAGTGVQTRFLGFRDGTVKAGTRLISEVESALCSLKPTVLITHYVDHSGSDHQDHVVVGETAINVSQRIPDTRLILQPQPICPSNAQCNYFVDITSEFDEKIKALDKHASQFGKFYLTRYVFVN